MRTIFRFLSPEDKRPTRIARLKREKPEGEIEEVRSRNAAKCGEDVNFVTTFWLFIFLYERDLL